MSAHLKRPCKNIPPSGAGNPYRYAASKLAVRFPILFDVVRWVLEAGFSGERRVIRAELKGGLRTLDIGCGTGEFANCFKPNAYFGVDLSPEFIRRAKGRREGSFKVMDARRLLFKSREFDQILIVGLLHHLADADAERVLREAARVLRKGGKAVVIEDVPSRTIPGFFGGLVHLLDAGGHIRDKAGYAGLLEKRFHVRNSYFMCSGVCDYAVFALER